MKGKRSSMQFYLIITGLILIIGFIFFRKGKPPINNILPREVFEGMKNSDDNLLLDVRSMEEFQSRSGYIKGAKCIPVQGLSKRIEELKPFIGKNIIVYCQTGLRSRTAVKILDSNGYRALNMTGGLSRWNSEQLPVVMKGKS